MNRFLTRKKKDGRKGQGQAQPELNLASALPSKDDFRTSLIMPNLSARFSMLREQDDPTSKLGKASDDSVLQPRRQSRLVEFGYAPTGLSDIAEDSSTKSSVRPPFASARQGSLDSYGTDEDSAAGGSMMNRARPGESNVLFGGRQKIYKIPVGASPPTNILGNVSTRAMGGRALYEDDVSVSAFQQLKREEREAAEAARSQQAQSETKDQELENPTGEDLSHSSLQSEFHQKRQTSSSTTSGQSLARSSSTAATSIASQETTAVPAPSSPVPQVPATAALDRSNTKARRLYEQGLDRDMHDQQHSALNRLNSIQGQRTLNRKPIPPYLGQVKSTSNLQDRYNRQPNAFGAGSSPPSAPLSNIATFGIAKEPHSSSSSPSQSYPTSPPLSPLGPAPESETLSAAIDPNDRGKATAMGAFNKPQAKFDEQQYLQRQLQMQQGRDTPPPLRKLSPRRKSPPPRKSPPRGKSPARPVQEIRADFERRRAEANTVGRSRTPSLSQKPAPTAFSVFHNAMSQLKTATLNDSSDKQEQHSSAPQQTFFASGAESDSEEELNQPAPEAWPLAGGPSPSYVPDVIAPSDPVPPPVADHPAFRSQESESQVNSTPKVDVLYPEQDSEQAGRKPSIVKSDATDVDSPTLGPTNGGLSGLVRQHLRNTSNQSSLYNVLPAPLTPADPNALQPRDANPRLRGPVDSETDTEAHSTCSRSNPFDLEDLDGSYGEADSFSSASPVDGGKENKRPLDVRPKGAAPEQQATSTASWEQELRKTHTRDGSTETQQEREAFANELAMRQKAIQESLRNKVDNEVRSESPAPGVSSTLKVWGGLLKPKSSGEFMATRQIETPAKALKMLGLGSASTNTSSVSLVGLNGRSNSNEDPRLDEERNAQDPSKGPLARFRARRVPQQSEQDAQRELEQQAQRGCSTERSSNPNGSSTPASSQGSLRNRSSSEVSSGRSRSRTGRYRDDLEKAMVEGTGSKSASHPEISPVLPSAYASSPRISHEAAIQHQHPGFSQRSRARSTSRPPAPSYFDQKSLHPGHSALYSPFVGSATPSPGVSPRLSPGLLSSNGTSIRPSPIPSPYSANTTPPISAASTPIAANFNAATVIPSNRVQTARKRSIQKSAISEPCFISSTSVVDTVDLPPGASLKNGQNESPPIPPVNPRRRRFGFGRSHAEPQETSPPRMGAGAARAFSSDAEDGKFNPKPKLRKSSSEGRNLRQQDVFAPSAPMPPRPAVADGAMF
ncbi:hypothetical protein H2201_006050 [Coniosporium apollinis]|uniref:DUF4045 domain-containing protein n=1 Tax=Coniosporium apollinis TaxID=61459 RepID=A0ABQ9NN90_9PEZI|nr:hypothetical protein H2201_006050 [Coniosporium apollinis]